MRRLGQFCFHFLSLSFCYCYLPIFAVFLLLIYHACNDAVHLSIDSKFVIYQYIVERVHNNTLLCTHILTRKPKVIMESFSNAETMESVCSGAPLDGDTLAAMSHVDRKTISSRYYHFIKRSFDLCFSFILGIILLIPMLIIALIIKLDSPGPVLFRQERLGKCGRPFTMIKFRSMCVDAEKDGPKWADREDKRCTKFGRALRKSRLDELPQLWNILIGNMSFVGPRPERACFYEEFDEYIPEFKHRLQVTPGLTGLAQINGGYELKPEEKIVYDMYYIRNRSFSLDLSCMFKTVRLMFTHEGAR